jgi:tetratricopeptide (TPR) repeat protein
MVIRRIKKYIVIAVSAVALTIGLVLVLVYFSNRQNILSVSSLLKTADDSIASGYLYKSEEATRKAYSISASEETVLMVLKRAYKLMLATDNPRILVELSSNAAKRYPASEKIAAIYSYSLLRNRREAEALSNIRKSGLENRLDTIFIEAALTTGSKIDAKLLATLQKKNPELSLLEKQDAELYEQIYPDIHDTRVLLNAALLYAQAGRLGDALKVVEPDIRDILSGEEYSSVHPELIEPLFFIAYDANRLDDALRLTDRLPSDESDKILLKADTELLMKNYADAQKDYLIGIDSDPAYSATPYLNSAWISARNGNPDSAIRYLEKAHALFPDSRDVIVELARLAASEGDIETGKKLISDFRKTNRNDPEIELMMLDFETRNLSVSQYRLRLWELFNKDPVNELIGSILISNCLLFEDTQSAIKAIQIVRARIGGDPKTEGPPWLAQYEALILAMQGKPEESLSMLSESHKKNHSRINGYNLALLLVKTKRYNEAEKELWNILRVRTESEEDSKTFFSRVSSLYSQALLSEGNFREAKRFALKALEDDKGNYRALDVLSEVRKRTETD